MKFIYLGDIMGDLGLQATKQVLPSILKKYNPDFIVAQAENVDNGKGISISKYDQLKSLGIDFLTGGNWTLYNPEIYPYLEDPNKPIIRPANYPSPTPGLKYKYLNIIQGKVLIISLLGKIVGKDANLELDNPLKTIDQILEEQKGEPKIATIVNYHGDYSSEKVVIGHYLDGRVTAVIGDHWHVPTNDPRILPRKTAHISDVGMIGARNSSLGVKLDVIIARWRDNLRLRNVLEDQGEVQFNGIVVEFNPKTKEALTIFPINEYF
jgi:metallophosphoesterase (TIGR00282 family)